jgi:hypothetical protein
VIVVMKVEVASTRIRMTGHSSRRSRRVSGGAKRKKPISAAMPLATCRSTGGRPGGLTVKFAGRRTLAPRSVTVAAVTGLKRRKKRIPSGTQA